MIDFFHEKKPTVPWRNWNGNGIWRYEIAGFDFYDFLYDWNDFLFFWFFWLDWNTWINQINDKRNPTNGPSSPNIIASYIGFFNRLMILCLYDLRLRALRH